MTSVLHIVSMSLDDCVYKCWSAIGVKEGLSADEDIVQFLVSLYSSVRQSDQVHCGVRCSQCLSPLSLYCSSCHLPSPFPPETHSSTLPSSSSLLSSASSSSSPVQSSSASALLSSSVPMVTSTMPSIQSSILSSLTSSSKSSLFSSASVLSSSPSTLSTTATSTKSSSPALSSHVLHHSTQLSSSDTATTGVQPHQTDRNSICPPDVGFKNEGCQSDLLNEEETQDSEDFSFDLDIVKIESLSHEPAVNVSLMPLNANERSKSRVCLQRKAESVKRKQRCSSISYEQLGPSHLSTLNVTAPTLGQSGDNVKREHDFCPVQGDENDGDCNSLDGISKTQLSFSDSSCNTDIVDRVHLCPFSNDEQCTSRRNLKRKRDITVNQAATKPKRKKDFNTRLMKKTESKHKDSLSRLRRTGRHYHSENTNSLNKGEEFKTNQFHIQDPSTCNKSSGRNIRIQKKLSKKHKEEEALESIDMGVKCPNSNSSLKSNSDENKNLQKEGGCTETETGRTVKKERDLSLQTKVSENHGEQCRKYQRTSLLEEGFDIHDDVRHSAQIHVYDQSFFERHKIASKPCKRGKTQRQKLTIESGSPNTRIDSNISNSNKRNNGDISTEDYTSLKILVSSKEIFPQPKKDGNNVFNYYAYFECALCGKAFFQRITFNRHLRTHTDHQFNTDLEKKVLTRSLQTRREQNKAISLSNKKASDKPIEIIVQPQLSEETLHNLRERGRKQKFECDICGKVYNSEFPLNNHMKLHTQNNGIMKCSFCTFETCDFFVYKKHQYQCKYYKRNSSFQCDICGVHLKSLKGLRYHIAGIHEKDRPFACNVCGKCFVTQASLTFHVKTCHTEGAKRFHCDQCPSCFVRRSDLHKHFISVHSTQRPFTCHFCPSAFAARYTLDVHLRQHTGEKPYTCNECLKPFTQKSNLTQHMRLHHSGTRKQS